MVPLRAPKAFVGHRNWVYDTVWKEDKGQVRDMPGSMRLRPTQRRCMSPTAILTSGTWKMTSILAKSVPEPLPVVVPEQPPPAPPP